MDLGLTGRTAAVAAGSSGLGLASAAALLSEGVQVVICGRDPTRLKEAASRLGEGAIPLVCDVGTPDGARSFVRQARDELGGRLDILVTNAGGPPAGTFSTTEFEAYAKAVDLNLMSVVGMCVEAVPAMREQGWGRVVAITSISVRQPIPNLILSNTARAGATGFLKTLAREVAGDGVTVNSVQPGLHATPRVTSIYGDNAAQATVGVPAGRMGDPGDFGAAVAFLCSEQANFITGAALAIDGGAYQGLQ